MSVILSVTYVVAACGKSDICRRHLCMPQIELFLYIHLEEDGDAEVHEGHGEVDALLALVGDGQVRHGQVRLLQKYVHGDNSR